jgi:hypothetical protein
MGLVLESAHRGPRGAAHAAQGHRASRLPAVTFALRLRTGGPSHASSQRERGALVIRMLHVFTSAARPIRAAAKTAIFFLKVFPLLPSSMFQPYLFAVSSTAGPLVVDLHCSGCGRTTSSGNFVLPRMRSVTLPRARRWIPLRPCVAMARRSQPPGR